MRRRASTALLERRQRRSRPIPLALMDSNLLCEIGTPLANQIAQFPKMERSRGIPLARIPSFELTVRRGVLLVFVRFR